MTSGPPRTVDRRKGRSPDSGERRRSEDYEGIERELGALGERIEDAEDRLSVLDGRGLPGGVGLLERIAAIQAQLNTIERLATGIDGKADKLSSAKSWTLAVLGLLVPVIVAIVAGYFALKAATPQALPK